MPVKKPAPAKRLASFRKALTSDNTFDAVTKIRDLIAEKGKEQQVVVWAYACILETNSAGLSILFERFTKPEIARIERALGDVGATKTVADLKALRAAVEKAVGSGLSKFDASDKVQESTLGRTIAKRTPSLVTEMEAALLQYCKEHVEKLAAL